MTAPGPPPRWCIVGPTHPYRGGIARHTTLLADAAVDAGVGLRLVSFARQYPGWLYKGATDRDPEQLRPAVAPDYLLDGVGPRSWWSTGRAIADGRPDLLITVWWHPFLAPALGTVVRRVRRLSPATTCVALCHNVLPHEGSITDRALVRYALARQDGIVVHSDSEASTARQLLDGMPITVSPHPTYQVEVDHGVGRRPGEPLTLLSFGLVREYKGVDVLLRALPKVLEQRPVRLVVAGEFWDPIEPYQELVRELGIADHVELRDGYVPEAELSSLLDGADLMVAPYRSATQSGAVEMAFGAGLPVVASDVGGLGDQIDDGVNGLLVPPEDVGALARALVEATEPDALVRLRAGAAARAPERTWGQLVDDLTAFTQQLGAHRTPE